MLQIICEFYHSGHVNRATAPIEMQNSINIKLLQQTIDTKNVMVYHRGGIDLRVCSRRTRVYAPSSRVSRVRIAWNPNERSSSDKAPNVLCLSLLQVGILSFRDIGF